MGWKWLLALILVVPFAGQVLGQSTDEGATPLGDVAKKNKDCSKNKAKQVITDDDMSARRKNPIPVISIAGADNSAGGTGPRVSGDTADLAGRASALHDPD